MLFLLVLMVVCVLRCVTKKATKKAREEKPQKVMTPHYAQPYWQSNQAQVRISMVTPADLKRAPRAYFKDRPDSFSPACFLIHSQSYCKASVKAMQKSFLGLSAKC